LPTLSFFIAVKETNGLRGENNMAKSHYSLKKRKKELAREQKQKQKRQRKLDKNSIKPEEAFDQFQDEVKDSLA